MARYNPMKCLVDECRLVTINEFCPVHRDEEAYECDACGEMKHDDDKGETTQHGTIWAGAIDPPDYTWVCSACVAMHEEMEIDRHEARMDAAQDLYYYEK